MSPSGNVHVTIWVPRVRYLDDKNAELTRELPPPALSWGVASHKGEFEPEFSYASEPFLNVATQTTRPYERAAPITMAPLAPAGAASPPPDPAAVVNPPDPPIT